MKDEKDSRSFFLLVFKDRLTHRASCGVVNVWNRLGVWCLFLCTAQAKGQCGAAAVQKLYSGNEITCSLCIVYARSRESSHASTEALFKVYT